MGMYSNFETLVPMTKEEISTLEDLSRYQLSDEGNRSESKWYDFQVHLKGLSEIFPNKVFKYYQNAYDYETHHVIFALNGKTYCEEIKMIFPDFDANKLLGDS